MLWRVFDRARFEDGAAAERVAGADVLLALDYPAFFHLLGMPQPDGRGAILDALRQDRLIAPCDAGGFDITNLGAILIARTLDDFPRLRRKAMRVIEYRGRGRTDSIREREHVRGYAVGFEDLMRDIDARLPEREVIGPVFRQAMPEFPLPAMRELVANALMHQDFFVSGAGPMVEIFDGRVEITNPGKPLVDTARFLDNPPKSRNEQLTSIMRRVRICEERGSGIDKVVAELEQHHLPAPRFETPPGFTRVLLFGRKALAEMDREERLQACYLHACLRYVTRDYMTNTSVRARFGIDPRNRSMASRLIRDAVAEGLIAPRVPDAAPRLMQYVPGWAVK